MTNESNIKLPARRGPKPSGLSKQQFNAMLPPDVVLMIKERSCKLSISQARLVELAVMEYLDDRDSF